MNFGANAPTLRCSKARSPGAAHVDFRGKDVRDAAVVWLGTRGPKNIDLSLYRRVLGGRNRYAGYKQRGNQRNGPPHAGDRIGHLTAGVEMTETGKTHGFLRRDVVEFSA